MQCLDNPDPLRAAGPTVNGTKYFITTAAPGEFINGKKGELGFSVYKTKTAAVCCFFDGNGTPNGANSAMAEFSQYISGLGF